MRLVEVEVEIGWTPTHCIGSIRRGARRSRASTDGRRSK